MPRGQVNVDYHQYEVAGGCPDGDFVDELPGLARRSGGGWVVVITGAQYGEITVEGESVMDPPSAVEEGWDVVGEVDVLVEDGEALLVSDWAGPANPEIGNLAITGPGLYRLRIHARGRLEGVSDPAAEHHRLICWPVKSETRSRFLTQLDAYGEMFVSPPTLKGPIGVRLGQAGEVFDLNDSPPSPEREGGPQ